MLRSILVISLSFLISILAQSVGAATFKDNFNRDDGAVGNGWTTPEYNGLVIRNETLTAVDSPYFNYGGDYVYREFNFKQTLTVSTVISDRVNPISGRRNFYNSAFGIGFNERDELGVWTGLQLVISRTDSSYSNSAVLVYFDGESLGSVWSSFQFRSSVQVNVTFDTVNNVVSGTLVDGIDKSKSFDFSIFHAPRSRATNNFIIRIYKPGGHSASTFDNLTLVSDDKSVARSHSVALLRVGTSFDFDSMWFAQGHAWIELYSLPGNNEKTWGTYPAGNWNFIWKGYLYDDLEKDSLDMEYSRSMFLSQAQLDSLMEEVDFYYALEDDAWSVRYNCTVFATDAWKAATGERIKLTKEKIGFDIAQSIPLPISLADVILTLNGGRGHRTINTCYGSLCGTACPYPAVECNNN